MPERGAEPKETIVTEAETSGSQAAMKELVGGGMRNLSENQFFTLLFQSPKSPEVRPLDCYNSVRGEPFGLYLPVSCWVAIISKV